jgi:isoleucyl-tRNA synthetase
MYRIVRALTAAEAPIVPFTAEEIWSALPGKKEESVHLARFDALDDVATQTPGAAWERLTKLREEASVILEEARRQKLIGSSLEGAIALTANEALEADRAAAGARGADLADLFIVSETREGSDAPADLDWRDSQAYSGLKIAFVMARGRRCERCWKVKPEVEESGLCARCRSVIGGAAA